MPTFRVEELATVVTDDGEQVRRYECRYYRVPTVPDNWDTMPLDDKGQFCWDNGGVTWFYSEDTDGDPTDRLVTVSVERVG